jgi:CSLREA domain-containing protein/uncharacterized repeat protein (TIGR01451 family)
VLLFAVVFSLTAPLAHAAPYVVNTPNDNTTAGDSLCTLREAIQSANNAGNSDCGSNSTADDTITFSVSGMITLSSTLPSIEASATAGKLTIDGGGSIIISGNNSVRVFNVNSGADLTLENLTVTGGNSTEGGGIYNFGTVTVSNSTFSGNSASSGGGGIYNSFGGTVTVSNSTFSGNSASFGGGILNTDTMTVSNSTFSGNSSSSGGGILNSGTMTVSNSTFSGNSASSGGGIFNVSTVTVSNSTFSGNSASSGGGGIVNFGTVTVSNSTFSGNSATGSSGGAIRRSGGTATLKNTIVANSTSGGNCSGVITNGGGNLSYPDSTCPGINLDPNLGPLQINAPGTTATHALLSGSAAIDAVTDCTDLSSTPVTQDQRGVMRPQGGTCDIGAYEAEVRFFTLTVTGAGTGAGTVTATNISCSINAGATSGDCSEAYDHGTVVALTGTAGANSVFAGFTGDPDCNDASVTLDADKSCTATFNLTPPSVSATKEDSDPNGSPYKPGDTIQYTVVLTNSGGQAQANNPSDEFSDTITSVAMLNAAGMASSGTLTVNPSIKKVTWNGVIPAGGSVTLTFSVRIPPGFGGMLCNQGTAYFDADNNGSNETAVLTSDPTPAAGAPSGQTCVSITERPETYRIICPPRNCLALDGIEAQWSGARRALGFWAQGTGIQAIAVRVFSLTGKRVYASGWVKNGFEWNLQSTDRQKMANGVYLYVIAVKGIDGSVQRTQVKKFVIQR